MRTSKLRDVAALVTSMAVLVGIPAVGVTATAPAAHAKSLSDDSRESLSEGEKAAAKAAETGERVEIAGERTRSWRSTNRRR
ncbi:hypothetical protein [Streptomyces sp. NPDC127072]|uniref:hypothetical protein n=1 Tax=Streptomyces sp. NPDC127072 TaxID=3347129 RepID=UPI00364FF0C5